MKRLSIVAVVLASAVILALPTSARADTFAVQVFDDGILQPGIAVLVVGDSLIFTGTTTHFSITNGSGTSNNPGTATSSSLGLTSSEQISTDFGAAGGTNTITIVLSQTDFLAPTGSPLTLTSSAGGSIADNGGTSTVSSTYQGFLDISNTLFGQPPSGATPLQTASAMLTSVGTSPLLFSPSISSAIVPGGTPFSLTDVLTFTFTVSPGSGQTMANAGVHTTAIPEPSSLLLLGSGLLGLGGICRRKLLG